MHDHYTHHDMLQIIHDDGQSTTLYMNNREVDDLTLPSCLSNLSLFPHVLSSLLANTTIIM